MWAAGCGGAPPVEAARCVAAAARSAAMLSLPRLTLLTGGTVDEAELTGRLHALTQEHRDLDAAIDALRSVAGHDQIQLARLKKRKLRLRDEIAVVQDWLIPDIIA